MPETLEHLLRRWGALCPDECETIPHPDGTCYGIVPASLSCLTLTPDELGDEDCGAILAAVVYHSARRALPLDLQFVHGVEDWHEGEVALCADAGAMTYHENHASAGDGSAALRALATSALSAYLAAVRASRSAEVSP